MLIILGMLIIDAGGQMMDPIIINKEEVLILKTEMLVHPRDVEKVRNDVIRQIKGGAVIIPNGFTYTICKRDCLEQEKELIFECLVRNRYEIFDICISEGKTCKEDLRLFGTDWNYL